MTEFPMTGPGGPGWCPKRADQVTLHEVDSAREGQRCVLKHDGTGAYFDLPRGAQDAFVWARLDVVLPVGEMAYVGTGERYTKVAGDVLRELRVGIARKNRH